MKAATDSEAPRLAQDPDIAGKGAAGRTGFLPADSTAPARDGHLPVLDGVRAFSILLVLAGHLLPLGPRSMGLNAPVAGLGMALFFCLSGFLIVSFLDRRPKVGDFLVRRIFRIVPALALYLLIALALNTGVTWQAVAINLAFVSNYFYAGLGPGPTGHLWSLSVEMQFYAAIALVVLCLGRRGLWLVPLAALVVTGLRIQAQAYMSISTHLRVDEILAGGSLALVLRHTPEGWLAPVRRSGHLGLPVLAVLWLASAHPAAGALNYARPYLTAALVGALLLAPPPRLRALLGSRPLRYVASISYALYLYHPLMETGILHGTGTVETYLLKRPVTFALSWAAAHLSTYRWELPWNRFARDSVLPRLNRRP